MYRNTHILTITLLGFKNNEEREVLTARWHKGHPYPDTLEPPRLSGGRKEDTTTHLCRREAHAFTGLSCLAEIKLYFSSCSPGLQVIQSIAWLQPYYWC